MSKPLHTITDHAVLRYLQAVYGIDVDAMKDEILTDDLRMKCEIGACSHRDGDLEYRIVNGRVTTVIGGKRRNTKRPRKKHAPRRQGGRGNG